MSAATSGVSPAALRTRRRSAPPSARPRRRQASSSATQAAASPHCAARCSGVEPAQGTPAAAAQRRQCGARRAPPASGVASAAPCAISTFTASRLPCRQARWRGAYPAALGASMQRSAAWRPTSCASATRPWPEGLRAVSSRDRLWEQPDSAAACTAVSSHRLTVSGSAPRISSSATLAGLLHWGGEGLRTWGWGLR